MAALLPGGAKRLLSPMKVEMDDPYYVAHIKGQEDRLSDEEYIELFHRFPDLLAKPIVTDGERILLGFDEERLNETFAVG